MNYLEKRLKEKYPDEKIKVISYTIMKERAQVQCLSCQKIYNSFAENYCRQNKTCFCYQCQNVKKLKQTFQERVNSLFPKEKLLVLEFKNQKKPATIKCLKCNTEYKLNHAENFLAKTSICKNCFPNKKNNLDKTKDKFLSYMKTTPFFKDFSFDYEKTRARDIIYSTCTNCGKRNGKFIYDYLKGKKCKCLCNTEQLTNEEYQKRLGIGYTLMSDYQGWNSQVILKHEDCGFIYKTNAKRVCCPKCKGSKGEKEIRYLLKTWNINFIEQYQIKIKNHLLRIDFYLPDYDLYIEFQGIQHYTPVPFFGGEQSLQKQVEYDQLKREYLGNKLLEIKYDEDISLKFNEYMLQKSQKLVEDFSD